MVRAPVTLVAAILVVVASSREVPQQVIEGTVLAFDSNVSLTAANEQTPRKKRKAAWGVPSGLCLSGLTPRA